jgi:Flp pilus assembly pilin Flp
MLDKMFVTLSILRLSLVDHFEITKEEGAGMVEYALLVALIGVALIGTLQLLTGGIAGAFQDAIAAL